MWGSLTNGIEALVLSPFKRVVVVDDEQRVVGIISDMVEMIDTAEHIEPLLTQLDPLIQCGVITVTSVEILQGRKEQG